MSSTGSSCVQLSDNLLLVSVADGRSWLTTVGSADLVCLPCSELAGRRSTVAASVVEGAIAAGLDGVENSAGREPPSFERYVRWLAGNVFFAAQTPGLFRQAAAGFEAAGRRELARFAAKKAIEEAGHAALARRDLEALGFEGEADVRRLQPASAVVFADLFRKYVESTSPVALFGFSYCLERVAYGRDRAYVRSVKAICPKGVRAFRFLKVHSAIGSDRAHVDEQLALFESMASAELALVAGAAYETAYTLRRQPVMDRTPCSRETADLERSGVVAASTAPP